MNPYYGEPDEAYVELFLGVDSELLERGAERTGGGRSFVYALDGRAWKIVRPRFAQNGENARALLESELELNSKFSPRLYEGVIDLSGLPALEMKDGGFPLSQKMEDGQLSRNQVQSLLEETARKLAEAHGRLKKKPSLQAGTPESLIRSYLSFNSLEATYHPDDWIAPYIELRSILEESLGENGSYRPLMASRRENGSVQTIHGDFHLGNVLVKDGVISIIDPHHEEGMREMDVAADVGEMAGDLEARGENSLAGCFVSTYIKESGDSTLPKVLPIYVSLKAQQAVLFYNFKGDSRMVCRSAEIRHKYAQKAARGEPYSLTSRS